MRNASDLPGETEAVGRECVDAAFRVHSELGPGLLESVYERCLSHELALRGLHVATQVELPVQYRGQRIEAGLRLDAIVEESVVVEPKAVEQVHACA